MRCEVIIQLNSLKAVVSGDSRVPVTSEDFLDEILDR